MKKKEIQIGKEKIPLVSEKELEKMLEKPQAIFIAGYSSLTDAEKIEADRMIADLKKKGHTISMGI